MTDLIDKINFCRGEDEPPYRAGVSTKTGSYKYCNIFLNECASVYHKVGIKHGCEYLGKSFEITWNDGRKWKVYGCNRE